MLLARIASVGSASSQLVALVATLARRLRDRATIGLPRAQALFGALLFATLPVVALQAPTAFNDLVVAASSDVRVLRARPARADFALAGLAVALLVGTKLTAAARPAGALSSSPVLAHRGRRSVGAHRRRRARPAPRCDVVRRDLVARRRHALGTGGHDIAVGRRRSVVEFSRAGAVRWSGRRAARRPGRDRLLYVVRGVLVAVAGSCSASRVRALVAAALTARTVCSCSRSTCSCSVVLATDGSWSGYDARDSARDRSATRRSPRTSCRGSGRSGSLLGLARPCVVLDVRAAEASAASGPGSRLAPLVFVVVCRIVTAYDPLERTVPDGGVAPCGRDLGCHPSSTCRPIAGPSRSRRRRVAPRARDYTERPARRPVRASTRPRSGSCREVVAEHQPESDS